MNCIGAIVAQLLLIRRVKYGIERRNAAEKGAHKYEAINKEERER